MSPIPESPTQDLTGWNIQTEGSDDRLALSRRAHDPLTRRHSKDAAFKSAYNGTQDTVESSSKLRSRDGRQSSRDLPRRRHSTVDQSFRSEAHDQQDRLLDSRRTARSRTFKGGTAGKSRISAGSEPAPPSSQHSRSRNHRGNAPQSKSQQLLQDTVRRALTSPSLQSVLSSLTNNTSSSSGSNSTVTPSSYDSSSRSHPSRSSRTKGSSSKHRRGTHRQRRSKREDHSEKINVFNYLEPDSVEIPEDPGWQSSDSSEDEYDHRWSYQPYEESSTRSSSASPISNRKPVRPVSWNGTDQLHSDSGISIRSSSPDSISKGKEPPQKPTVQDVRDEDSPSPPLSHANGAVPPPAPFAPPPDPTRHACPSPVQQEPELLQSPRRTAPLPPIPAAVVPYDPFPSARRPSLSSSDPSSATCSKLLQDIPPDGYDLLASHLTKRSLRKSDDSEKSSCPSPSSSSPPPLYRTFTTLNHRILLHLQDEICQLESQLHYLDTRISRISLFASSDPTYGTADPSCGTNPNRPPTRPTTPASRRLSTSNPTPLHYQRTDVVAKIFAKLGQYEQKLCSFEKAAVCGPSAKKGDVEKYRKFLDERGGVICEEERSFLDQKDLVVLGGLDGQRRNIQGGHGLASSDAVHGCACACGQYYSRDRNILLAMGSSVLASLVMGSSTYLILRMVTFLGLFGGLAYMGLLHRTGSSVGSPVGSRMSERQHKPRKGVQKGTNGGK